MRKIAEKQRLISEGVHHLHGFRREIQKYAPSRGALLDLGCGRNVDLAAYRNAGREVWGTDFEAHPEMSHPRWFRPLHARGGIPFPDQTFDLVACVMVLEHVRDRKAFLAEVGRVLRPGGHFVAHTISGAHYLTWMRRAFGLFPHAWNRRLVSLLYGREEIDTFPAFYRLNRESHLRKSLANTDLSLVSIERYSDQGYFRFSPALFRLAARIDRWLESKHAGWGRLYMTATFEKSRQSSSASLAS